MPPPSADVVKVAVLLVSGIAPEIATGPSKNVTLPVADAGAMVAVNVRDVPNGDGFAPALSARVTEEFAFGLLTACTNAAETDPSNVASPLYCAVIECVPIGSEEVVILAEPADNGKFPLIAIPLSRNTMVPVAELGATVAAKVSESPAMDGFVPAVKLMLTVVFPLTTVCMSSGLTEGMSLLSPV